MRKALIFLLVVGVLIFGTFSVIEELSQGISFQESATFSEKQDFQDGCENPTPDGGAGGTGGGQGGIPG